jgi:hypothetical protein
MSIPPTFALRSTNCSGVISPRRSAVRPYWTPTLSTASRPLPLGASGVIVTPNTARMKSAMPQRSPVGLVTGCQSWAAVRPQATLAVGTSSVRSAPNEITFCPHRLSGLVGLLPHTGSRAAAVANSALGGALAWPGLTSGLVGQK